MDENMATNPHTSLSYWLNETESPPHKISLYHQIAKRYREEPESSPLATCHF